MYLHLELNPENRYTYVKLDVDFIFGVELFRQPTAYAHFFHEKPIFHYFSLCKFVLSLQMSKQLLKWHTNTFKKNSALCVILLELTAQLRIFHWLGCHPDVHWHGTTDVIYRIIKSKLYAFVCQKFVIRISKLLLQDNDTHILHKQGSIHIF